MGMRYEMAVDDARGKDTNGGDVIGGTRIVGPM